MTTNCFPECHHQEANNHVGGRPEICSYGSAPGGRAKPEETASPSGSSVPCQPFQGNPVTLFLHSPPGVSRVSQRAWEIAYTHRSDLTFLPCCNVTKTERLCLNRVEHSIIKFPLFHHLLLCLQ